MARKTKKRKSSSNATPVPQPAVTRRIAMTKLAAYGVGGLAVLGGGAAVAVDFSRKLEEMDLSAIGQGTPVVVQIHDPQCSLCAELQRQTRAALRDVADDALIYKVANIRNEDGLSFQTGHGLPHVTLVLFDGAGQRVHVIEGVTPAAEIRAAFEAHLGVGPG